MKIRCIIPPEAPKQFGRSVVAVVAVLIAAYAARLVVMQTRASEPVHVQANANPRTEPVTLAAPGRIEGRSEAIGVGASLDGVVRAIYVKEGQWVAQGAILAELDCDDLRSGQRCRSHLSFS